MATGCVDVHGSTNWDAHFSRHRPSWKIKTKKGSHKVHKIGVKKQAGFETMSEDEYQVNLDTADRLSFCFSYPFAFLFIFDLLVY